MFKEMTTKIDEILDLPKECFIFGEIVAYLYNVPIWKMMGFYLYTFTYVKQREKGKEYRVCLKWATFPYTFRYKLFMSKLQRWFYNW